MLGFGTRAIHAGQNPSKEVYRPLIPPIVYSGSESLYDSSTLKCLEECIASLEYAKYALCYPSGSAVTASITEILDEGDHAILFDSVYHGTRTNFSIFERLGKIEVSFVDLRDPSVLEHHLRENTKIVWLETPSNPIMKIVDIAAIAKILKKRRKDAFLVVDNTFMTPYFQNPLLLGADIVIHSLTKYMNGHSDCLMGAMATNSDMLYARLKEIQDVAGMIPSPMDCFLVNRGLKTLHIRMEQHMKNALAIAQYLEQHPKVEKVFYPGLASHPQHELAKRQSRGFCGMVSFCIKGGFEEGKTFVRNLKVFTLAGSLGSTESLVDISSKMTVKRLPEELLKELEITENLIRMSIGIESVKDLLTDLKQAFDKV